MIKLPVFFKRNTLLSKNISFLLNSKRHVPQISAKMTETNKIIILNENKRSNQLELAHKTLNNSGVVALPTDTIYGIAALSQDSQAIKKIYEIKGRDFCKPLAVAIPSLEQIKKWVEVTVSRCVLEELYQGAVTLVFKRLPALNPLLNPSTPLVGIRIPSENFLLALSAMCSCPLALTSANKSSYESALAVEEFQSIWPSIDVVFDGGRISCNNFSKAGSTVVDLSKQGHFRIIRQGCALERTVRILVEHGLKEGDIVGFKDS